MTRLTTCLDSESVAERAAAHVTRQLQRAIEERRTAHIALSGGTTPGRTYELLAADPSLWEGVEVWFADERCVPPEDPESNYLLAEQALLSPAGIPAERVHRMRGELGPTARAVAHMLLDEASFIAIDRVKRVGAEQLLDVVVDHSSPRRAPMPASC